MPLFVRRVESVAMSGGWLVTRVRVSEAGGITHLTTKTCEGSLPMLEGDEAGQDRMSMNGWILERVVEEKEGLTRVPEQNS